MPHGSVLLVDDDVDFTSTLAAGLTSHGHRVATAGSLAEAIDSFDRDAPDVALLDLRLPDGHGLELLEALRARRGDTEFVILSGYGTVGEAVEAIKRGAVDFVEKPVRLAHLEAVIGRALAAQQLKRQVERLREDVERLQGTRGILGQSPAIRRVTATISKVAGARDTTVLLAGESGTGKELAARAIHDASPRKDGPFVAVNCAALSSSLLESELFGYDEASFTGAQAGGKEGLFEAAEGGTLFLDEISELEPPLQAKLLRVLQERRVRRVGGVHDRPVDIRVVASTNRDLESQVAVGAFRQDLYYRLRVAPIRMPALRDRGNDVLLLAEHYVRHFAEQMGKHADGLTDAARTALQRHDWPGNVRELRNIIEYAAILCPGGSIDVEHLNLPAAVASPLLVNGGEATAEAFVRALPDRKLTTLEKAAIEAVLEDTGGNVAKTARELGIHRQTLYNKIKTYGIRK